MSARKHAIGKPAEKGAIVAMFHLGRCGSKLLGRMLDQHSDIHWDGEIFHGPSAQNPQFSGLYRPWFFGNSEYFPHAPFDYLRQRISSSSEPAFGFDLQFWSIKANNLTVRQFVNELKQLGSAKIVLLKRENYLRQVVSRLVALNSSKWHQAAGELAVLQRIRLDPKAVDIGGPVCSLVDLFRYWDEKYQALDDATRGDEVLRLTYEDDVETNPIIALEKICLFAGVQPEPVAVPNGRTLPFPLSQTLLNFDEVSDALKNTFYEWMPYERRDYDRSSLGRSLRTWSICTKSRIDKMKRLIVGGHEGL